MVAVLETLAELVAAAEKVVEERLSTGITRV
jgi:hypothetical protein